MTASTNPTHVVVRRKYASIAKGGCCGPQSSCCGGGRAEQVARGLGYSDAELATLPGEANLGLSCGNPTALAGLQPGETVLDLGSGAGLDVFLAAQRVGPAGRVIGVDMTPEMLEKARANAVTFLERTGLANVEFLEGQIEAIPLPGASVDVVLSNCVLNLSPDQGRVWQEIARVLRPGGRVSISDMVLLRPLPEGVRRDVEALVGCIAGAALQADLEAMIRAAGLTGLSLVPKSGAVAAMLPGDDPMVGHLRKLMPEGAQPSDYIASLVISARKPGWSLAGGLDIRARQLEDLDAVRTLLAAADLPLEGLERTQGWVAEAQGRVVGHVALERTADAAVLRSLVVASDARSRGLARRLMDLAEQAAGVRTLLLKTGTIGPWAERRGYVPAGPEQIPASVLGTSEFEGSLCACCPAYVKGI